LLPRTRTRPRNRAEPAVSPAPRVGPAPRCSCPDRFAVAQLLLPSLPRHTRPLCLREGRGLLAPGHLQILHEQFAMPPDLVRCFLLNGLRRSPRVALLLPCESARSRRTAAAALQLLPHRARPSCTPTGHGLSSLSGDTAMCCTSPPYTSSPCTAPPPSPIAGSALAPALPRRTYTCPSRVRLSSTRACATHSSAAWSRAPLLLLCRAAHAPTLRPHRPSCSRSPLPKPSAPDALLQRRPRAPASARHNRRASSRRPSRSPPPEPCSSARASAPRCPRC
jgi:hypothetical protein